ncbi:hypothetical protein BDQ17DRAFT_1328974 [Cyathus striatus]|nr:hypothetical protein BDQ17DRAFT_1328974 [Cyathus striatus]
MYPYHHFHHGAARFRGPSRFIWFIVGAGTATWFIKCKEAHEREFSWYGRRPQIQQAQSPEPAPSQESYPAEPQQRSFPPWAHKHSHSHSHSHHEGLTAEEIDAQERHWFGKWRRHHQPEPVSEPAPAPPSQETYPPEHQQRSFPPWSRRNSSQPPQPQPQESAPPAASQETYPPEPQQRSFPPWARGNNWSSRWEGPTDEEKEKFAAFSSQAADSMTEITEATLDSVLNTAQALKQKLVEYRVQREKEQQREMEERRDNPPRLV